MGCLVVAAVERRTLKIIDNIDRNIGKYSDEIVPTSCCPMI
jgi:hypothetical protein